MKIADGLKIIQSGWIRKSKGFRVRFHKRTPSGFQSSYSPPLDDAPLTSDVTAWRYAWKLWQATRTMAEADHSEVLYNIVVVDDLDRPVPFYGTGKIESFNPKCIDETTVLDSGPADDALDSDDQRQRAGLSESGPAKLPVGGFQPEQKE